MVALPFSTFLLSPGDEVVKHASPGIFNTFYFLHICIYKEVYEVPACLDTFLGTHSLQSPCMHQIVYGRSIRSFKKKGRSSRALQVTNKLISEQLKFTGTRPLLANQ